MKPYSLAGKLAITARRLIDASAFLAFCGTAIALAGRWLWIAELPTHFRVQYALCSMIAAGIAAITRRWRYVAWMVPAAALNCWFLLPYFPGGDPDPSNGSNLRLASINVHTANRQQQRVIDFVNREQPDIVLFIEVNATWAKALAALDAAYPYHVAEPRADNFGIALYSRIELDDLGFRTMGAAELPSIVARLRVHGKALTLVGTHPLPPMSAAYAQLRNDQLAAVADLASAAKSNGSVIVVGDLNTTGFSPYFDKLVARSRLVDARRGMGLQSTWPSQIPPLWIAIDHCLVSPDIVVHDFRAGGSVGSDHFPIMVDLNLR